MQRSVHVSPLDGLVTFVNTAIETVFQLVGAFVQVLDTQGTLARRQDGCRGSLLGAEHQQQHLLIIRPTNSTSKVSCQTSILQTFPSPHKTAAAACPMRDPGPS